MRTFNGKSPIAGKREQATEDRELQKGLKRAATRYQTTLEAVSNAATLWLCDRNGAALRKLQRAVSAHDQARHALNQSLGGAAPRKLRPRRRRTPESGG